MKKIKNGIVHVVMMLSIGNGRVGEKCESQGMGNISMNECEAFKHTHSFYPFNKPTTYPTNLYPTFFILVFLLCILKKIYQSILHIHIYNIN